MPRASRSDVSYAKVTLPYPIFAADFDPYNRGYLVVGGGGGESRSGVPNQITVLDVSNRAALTTVAEVELSRDEDSVQSLGNLATKDGLIVYAGINSSEKEQSEGKNDHLRSFEVKYPPRKKQKIETNDEKDKEVEKNSLKLLGKRSLFKAFSKGDGTYQRLLRLSPSQRRDSGNRRVAAIATGMAQQSQLVVFNATSSVPGPDDILTSIDLPERAEANDIDLAEPEEAQFSVAYCTDYSIYEQTLKYHFQTKKVEKTPKGPRRVVQPSDSTEVKQHAKFRCLRFLNPQNVVALLNLPNKSGVELRVFHLYPTGPAMLMHTKKLPTHIKQATSMDVCAMDADAEGNQQFAIAVAGQDISIEVFTTNYKASTDTFSAFTSYITIRNVHQQGITKICFSPFHSPPRSTSPKTGSNGTPVSSTPHPGPQYIRLASVSYGNTVVVDTFPLSPQNPTDRNSRYILSRPNDETWMRMTLILVISLVVLVTAFLLQSFRTGFADDDSVGMFGFLPQNVRNFLDQPAAAAYNKKRVPIVESVASIATEAVPTAVGRLQTRLSNYGLHPSQSSAASPDAPEEKRALVLRSAPHGMDGVTVDVHPNVEAYRKKDVEAKHWHELNDEAKMRWKERLMKAGEWAEAEGEKVLLGVLFSEYAGLVGEGAQAAMREL